MAQLLRPLHVISRRIRHPRSRRVLYPGLKGIRAGAAGLRRRECRSIRWSANSACIMPASATPAARARAPCSRCARAKCRSSSSTARSSAAWSTRKCWRGPTRRHVRSAHRLELSGPGLEAEQAFSSVTRNRNGVLLTSPACGEVDARNRGVLQLRDGGIVPLICPTCQMLSRIAQSIRASDTKLLCMGLFSIF